MLENSYNVSFRATYDLPRQTHRYFVEAISGQKHLKSVLIKRFLNFIEQIKECPKDIVNHLLRNIEYDVGSVTGSNLRNIMHLLNKESIKDLKPNDASTGRIGQDGLFLPSMSSRRGPSNILLRCF